MNHSLKKILRLFISKTSSEGLGQYCVECLNCFAITLFYHAIFYSIDERRNQVIARRAAVKEAAAVRCAALDAARKFQEFSADVEDLRGWMADKLKTASDESYRDLTNLERKLQKHEAFERELHANEGQLRAVNKVLICYLLTPWRHDPWRVKTCLTNEVQTLLSFVFLLHPLSPISFISSSILSIYLFLSLPICLLPPGFPVYIFFQ